MLKRGKANKRIYDEEYRRNNRSNRLEKDRRYSRNLKDEVFSVYGKACVCCGETARCFLTIDHIDHGGGKHRKQVGGGRGFYLWLRRENFPKGFQTLCHNCNCAKQFDPKGHCAAHPNAHLVHGNASKASRPGPFCPPIVEKDTQLPLLNTQRGREVAQQ